MVKLLKSDIKTSEVLNWKGVHLLHAGMSSCSQKSRIFLNLKGIDWTGHYVDLPSDANHEPWFLGINPRGLVPVLVHDGDVHIESNDIMLYIEHTFPEPKLIPDAVSGKAKALLDLENKLHMDLRALTFRFVFPNHGPHLKNPVALERYKANAGTVGGKIDPEVKTQIDWWEAANKDGITNAQVISAVKNFNAIFKQLDSALESNDYLLGDTLSGADIAWFIYCNRLCLAGYPLEIHPHLHSWFAMLETNASFSKEINLPAPFEAAYLDNRAKMHEAGNTLIKISGLTV